ncbi:MAG TPA: rRNA maturation RNase YbeY [Vicinamibacterales bacterium]|nr:rRNA maturation RNase YbeY [Vicinamibacterales bacterium]
MPDGDQRPGLHVAVTDGSGRPARAPGLSAWLRRVAPARARGAVSVALVPDGAMRRLNREYARVDHVTDVLSFPAAPPAGASARLLGDIVIATGVARRQARAAGHAYSTELRVLALHGLLHLLGYDHHDDGGRMARAEARLRRRGGLPTGLIERARAL